jgi:hypothetical protein
MQNSIYKLETYCNQWGLTVNPGKTKILVINPLKSNTINIELDHIPIETVDEVNYLGLVIDKHANFKQCLKSQYHKGLKALFKLVKTIDSFPGIDTGMHLFDHMVKPVILYGSEIWTPTLFGIRNNKKVTNETIESLYQTQKPRIEMVYQKYCKRLLGLPQHTDNLVPYGELGTFPLYIESIDWHEIEFKSRNPLLLDAYSCQQHLQGKSVFTWLGFVTNIKRSFTKDSSSQAPNLTTINKIKHTLKEQFARYWMNSLWTDSKTKSEHGRKLRTYRLFKIEFGREYYLQIISNPKWRIALTRFRASAHRLMIEIGRRTKTELNKRLCPKCAMGSIEDEEHFLMTCPAYQIERNKLMSVVQKKSPLFNHLDVKDRFCWIVSNNDHDTLIALAEFVTRANERRHGPS